MRFSTLLHKKGISTINGEKQAEEENTKDMNILARLPKTKSTNEHIEKNGWNDAQQQSPLHKTNFYVQSTAHSGQIIAEA
jgi:hypothetical protein